MDDIFTSFCVSNMCYVDLWFIYKNTVWFWLLLCEVYSIADLHIYYPRSKYIFINVYAA